MIHIYDFSISPKSKSLFTLFRDLVGLGGLVGQGDLDLGLTRECNGNGILALTEI